MEITLLVDRFDYKDILNELRDEWLTEILMFLGIDPSEIESMSDPHIIDLFFENNIEVIDYPSLGAMEVHYKGEVIGEWAGPEFELQMDKETDELYFKVSIEHWSILEEEIDMG